MGKNKRKICCLLMMAMLVVYMPMKISSAESSVLTVGDVLGVTHVSGKYYMTSTPQKDFLNEGADKIEQMGSKVFKIWLNSSPSFNYPWNSDWTQFGTLSCMADLVKTSYYQNAINRAQFKTIVFEASEFTYINWKNGLSTAERNAVYNDFYSLTVYLLTNYKNSGKTFVLQNWEGDNAIGFNDMTPPPTEVQQQMINGMADWLNTRQDAITQARKDVGTEGVMVAGAAEINLVPTYTSFDFPTVIDTVVPKTHMDLYSYSNWSTKVPGREYEIVRNLDYIKEKAPDSELFGEYNVFLGEFGCYEDSYFAKGSNTWDTVSDRTQRQVIGKQLEHALRWGIKFAINWELYSNGLKANVTLPPGLQATVDQLKGVWLIRPDGSETSTLKYFTNITSKSLEEYKTVYEAENHLYTVSGSGTVSEISEASLYGTLGLKFYSPQIGDSLNLSLYVAKAGSYRVLARVKKNSLRGIYQLSIDDKNCGNAIDYVNPPDVNNQATLYPTVEIGKVDFSENGFKNFKFTLTGRNNGTGDFLIDCIKLIPSDVDMFATFYKEGTEIKKIDSIGTVDCSVQIRNNTFGDIPFSLVAVYSVGNMIRSIQVVPTSESLVTAQKTKTLSTSFDITETANAKIKLYLWDGVSTMKPLYRAISIDELSVN